MNTPADTEKPFLLRHINDIFNRIEQVSGKKTARWVSLIALAMSLYHLTVAYLGQPVTYFHLPIHLLFAFLVIFWSTPVSKDKEWKRFSLIWNIFMSGLTMMACGYLFFNIDYVQTRIVNITPLTPLEYVLGFSIILVILEATRRTIGWVLVNVVLVFLVYAKLGSYLPYPFWHRGYSFRRILEKIYFTTDGIWGVPLGVTAAFVFLFILFAALLIHSGGGEFFTRLARSMTGRTVGGPAKVAVVASTFMGMLSGSSPANVVTTGSFTIPAMKKRGYTSEFAGGVEAAASANGQLTPPIMGAAAFVMMEFLGISYLRVILYAAIPAFLCFLAVYIMVHLEAKRLNLSDDPSEKVYRAFDIIKQQGYLMIAVVVLLFFLLRGYTPGRSCFWSIISLILLLALFDRRNRSRIINIIIAAMASAPHLIGSVSAACAAAGIIVGMILLTGLGLKVSTLVLFISAGHLLPTLIFTMIIAVILSMGMPTSSAYIVLAVLLAPAMIDMGVLPISAHMFVLYCASKSSITPPVAISSYAAAAMAKSDPWKTSIVAFRIALTIFIIPYMFVFGPALLGIGSPLQVIWTVITASIGLYFLGAASIGWLFLDLKPIERIVFFLTSLTMIAPGWLSDTTGFIVGGGLTGFAYWRSRNRT